MNKTVSEYGVIYGTMDDLDLQVNKHIVMGWQPFGGIAFSPNDNVYAQAVVRYKEQLENAGLSTDNKEGQSS